MDSDNSSIEECEMSLQLLRDANLLLENASSSDDESIAINLLNVAASMDVMKDTEKKDPVGSNLGRRNEKGSYQFLMKELKTEDPEAFFNYIRMTNDTFQILLSYVKDDLTKEDTTMRNSKPADERLFATQRFLATGESFKSLSSSTRLSIAFLSEQIPSNCEVIWQNLKDIYLKFPCTKTDWEQIAERFALRWQFPLCLGALDGKHIKFEAKKKDGGFYYNYKGYNSIILMALVDADCRFLFVDIGRNGRANDAAVFSESNLYTVMQQSEKYFPKDKVIGNGRCLPYVIVGDDAFALHRHLMKPYAYRTKDPAKQNFNYRLSRARQNVERAFGIISTRFQVLKKAIQLDVDKVEGITKAIVVLHNFLLHHQNKLYLDLNFETEEKEEDEPAVSTSASSAAEAVRQQFANYFFNEGKI